MTRVAIIGLGPLSRLITGLLSVVESRGDVYNVQVLDLHIRTCFVFTLAFQEQRDRTRWSRVLTINFLEHPHLVNLISHPLLCTERLEDLTV